QQNYPNPFNPTTTIAYQLPVAAVVKLDIFNTLGQKIRTLVEAPQTAGNYQQQWDGLTDDQSSAANGIYIYRIQLTSGKKIIQYSRKMVLLK
ncbi:T9SS type A sorting domain-containing protein, partial [candidate division KSB1 bacterium]|nr:T9SS type A sorting domain-containing protein [candidate division KSB1 bacterium]